MKRSARILLALWIILLIFLTCVACSPSRRIQRILKRNPELAYLTDTVTVHDTISITIPGTEVDTIVTVRDLLDTVYIDKDHLHAAVYLRNDTVFIRAACDTITQTLTRTIRVPHKVFVYRRPRDGLIQLLNLPFRFWFTLSAIVILAAWWMRRKRNKNIGESTQE